MDLALNETNEKYAKMAEQRYIINKSSVARIIKKCLEKEVADIRIEAMK